MIAVRVLHEGQIASRIRSEEYGMIDHDEILRPGLLLVPQQALSGYSQDLYSYPTRVAMRIQKRMDV